MVGDIIKSYLVKSNRGGGRGGGTWGKGTGHLWNPVMLFLGCPRGLQRTFTTIRDSFRGRKE